MLLDLYGKCAAPPARRSREEFAAPIKRSRTLAPRRSWPRRRAANRPSIQSNEPNFQTDVTNRFEADADAKALLATTVRVDSVKAEDYDTVFYPGGHGPMGIWLMILGQVARDDGSSRQANCAGLPRARRTAPR